jgi:hypothetical protein
MRKKSVQKALFATARVACCAALVGISCSEKSEVDVDDTSETSSTLDCEDLIADTFGLGGSFDLSDVNQETKDCCQTMAEYYDQQANLTDGDGDVISEWKHRDDCCAALDWQGSMACTPWGPPTPPIMCDLKGEKNVA